MKLFRSLTAGLVLCGMLRRLRRSPLCFVFFGSTPNRTG